MNRIENRSPRTTILRIAAALLAVLVLATLLLLFHPILLTGRYYEMSIQSVDFEPNGMVTITYDDVITYDTYVTWCLAVKPGGRMTTLSWAGSPRGFLRWPRKDHRTFAFYLTTEEERAKGIQADSPAIRQRVLLKEGTYLLRPGEKLVTTRMTLPDGTPIETFLEFTPSP